MYCRNVIIPWFILFMMALGASGAHAGNSVASTGQPQNFIFGYGSLINTQSRNSTASKPIKAIPVRVSASFGYVRGWVDRVRTGYTALGLRKPQSGEKPMTINGVLYPVEGNDMSLFDAREDGYMRVEVPLDEVKGMSSVQMPAEGKIWTYVSVKRDDTPDRGLHVATADYPVVQSYVDIVIDGALEYGPDFAREVLETTTDWNRYWLNDRINARRPLVHEKNAGIIDKLLQGTSSSASYLKDRLLPEVYAVRNQAG